MKKLLIACALLGAGSLGLQDVSIGHGGTYRGPGDTVPPGGGGGGGGGGPSAPGPAGPAAPGPAGPAGPTATGGSAPVTGGAAATPNRAAVTGLADVGGPDLTVWSFWWEFNKDPYLNLKDKIHSGSVATGSDEFFLGRGEKSQAKDNLAPTEAQIRQTVVPALIRALENETNNDIVTGAMIALAKIGDAKSESGESEFTKIIVPFLKDSNQEIAETAGVALGILANPDSIPVLQSLVLDDAQGRNLVGGTEVNYRTRAFAAYGLGLIGYGLQEDQVEERAKVVDTLVEVIRSDRSSTRDIKVACLLSLGLVPIQTIDRLAVPEGAEAPPVSSSRMAQIDFLIEFFNQEENHYLLRAHAPTSIARLMRDLDAETYSAVKERVAPLFLEAIDKRSKARDEIMQSCVLTLGMIGDNDADEIDQRIRKALVDVVEDHSNQQLRNFSMIAAGQVGGHLGTGEEPGKGIDEVQKHLLKTLVRGKTTVKPWAGLGVGVMGALLADTGQDVSRDMQVALRDALAEEKTPNRVGAYAIAAGMLRDRDASELLRKKLQELRDDEARGYTALALGMMNDTGAIADIQQIVKDSKYRPQLLQQAATALGLLGDKNLVEDLVKMLKDAKGLSTQAAISAALGFIGDQRSIDPLVEMLENEDITNSARGFAAVALGIVADKEKLPWNSKIAVDVNYRASTITLNDTEGTGILNIL